MRIEPEWSRNCDSLTLEKLQDSFHNKASILVLYKSGESCTKVVKVGGIL